MKSKPFKIASSFPTLLPVPDGKGSWITVSPLRVVDSRIGSFTIPAGMWNDLASIPRVMRSAFPVNGAHRIAAMVHDYLYLVQGKLPEGITITREEADAIFYDVMRMPKVTMWESYNPYCQSLCNHYNIGGALISDKPLVGSMKAWTMYRAVRAGGWVSWKGKPKFDMDFIYPVVVCDPIDEEEASDEPTTSNTDSNTSDSNTTDDGMSDTISNK